MSGNQMLLLGGAQAPAVDPFFYSVTSLLHGDGTNGGQNNTFLDSSTNNFTITRNGNTTQGSFSPFSQTGWSNYFDGTGDYLSVADNVAFTLGSGNFTVECWIYRQTSGARTFIYGQSTGADNINTSISAEITASNKLASYTCSGTTAFTATSASDIPSNQWVHVAIVRNSTTVTQYINGIKDGEVSVSTSSVNDSGQIFGIGSLGSYAGLYWNGYISNFRLVKGTAVYTAAFTPPTTPLTAISGTSLLTCQANRFLDASSNNFTITRNGDVSVQPFSPFNPTTAYSTSAVGGSGYFDGSGDYLTVADNAALQMGSGDFTVEYWWYPNNITSYQNPIDKGYTGAGALLLQTGNGDGRIIVYASGSAVVTSSTAVAVNAWNHMALVRSGTTLTLYQNGVSVGSATNSTNFNNTATLGIGATATAPGGGGVGSFPVVGYLSGVRFVKGTAVYSGSTYTVPASPLTAIANTSLLCNFTNGAIFDNAAVADYETVGNAQISTSVKKYGTGSMAFDGTGDYLKTPVTDLLDFGTGGFTIECWAYFNNTADSGGLGAALITKSGGGTTIYSSTNGGTTLTFYNGSGIVSGTIALNTWQHIAVSRAGGVVKFFVNGNQTGSAAHTSAVSFSGAFVGSQSASGGFLNGYIDDLRVSKGVARYLYNFTPPTAALPDIGGTVTLTADPYYEYTTLLLPGNGTNGAQNNTFLDSSSNAFTITRNGNTTQGTFSPFSQTGWGNYLNGSTDYLTAASNAAFAVPAEYTVEFWAYQVASPTNYASYFMVNASGGLQIGFNTAGGGVFGVANNFVAWQLTTAAFPLNQWTHVAITRDSSNVTRIFYNGTQQTSGTITTSYAQGELRIGNSGANNGFINGYVSNMRYLKGTALYTSNFTPPTSPLTAITNTQLLTCQSNRFVDNSSNAFALTTTGSPSIQAFSPFNPTAAWSAATNGGSGYFDGSGDYLSVSAQSFSGDFTLEGWIYPTRMIDSGGSSAIFVSVSPNNQLSINSSGGSLIYYNGSTSTVATNVIQLNAWQHVAVSRSGTTTRVFVNGTIVATNSSDSGTRTFTHIGQFPDGNNYYFQGYMAGARWVADAQYTAAFTPTASPPTAVTNTRLLCNFTNAGIYDATSKNDLETVGNAQISTTQSKFGGSSMYFDGTGDYLVANNVSTLLSFGTGDFTVEAWVYMNSLPSGNGYPASYWIVGGGPVSSNTGFDIAIGSTNLQVGLSNFLSLNINVAHGMSAATWYHVAVCRYGSTLYAFKDGVLLASASVSGVTADPCLTGLAISAAEPVGATSGNFNGYIDDLRITKGIARYTSNFTPPSTAFLTL